MAVLTDSEKRILRNKVEKAAIANDLSIDYVKSEINDAFQAIEDWFSLTSTQSALSNAIDAGTSFSFTVQQKKQLVKYWLENRFGRE